MISRFGGHISVEELKALIFRCLEEKFPGLGAGGAGLLKTAEKSYRCLILPPEPVPLNSMAGPITAMAYGVLSAAGVPMDILPALGTHHSMTDGQLPGIFGNSISPEKFKVHDWCNGVVRNGLIDRLVRMSRDVRPSDSRDFRRPVSHYKPPRVGQRAEKRPVVFDAAPYDGMAVRYGPLRLREGVNCPARRRGYFDIRNPEPGLWSEKSEFMDYTVKNKNG